jgi:hypothetical protein
LGYNKVNMSWKRKKTVKWKTSTQKIPRKYILNMVIKLSPMPIQKNDYV